jgi:amino acid transporter
MGQPEYPRSGAAQTSSAPIPSAPTAAPATPGDSVPSAGSASSTAPSAGAPSAGKSANPLGMASLIVAIVLIALSTLRTGTNVLIPLLAQDFDTNYTLLIWVPTIMLGLVALVSLVLGVIALLQRGRRRTAAIIAVSVSASWLFTLVGGQILSAIVAATAAAAM